MNIKDVREYLLSKPGATEEVPFNMPVPVFKVGDKIFGLINIHEPFRSSINLKYPKGAIHALRSAYDEIVPGYHMNKDNWNTIYLDGNLSEDLINELIDISYDLIFRGLTKKKQEEVLGEKQQLD
ncbi:MAG TPA: MmcQ/YjbR family DNA-binding protein [Anaerovoracaceae bacterium]|nr:MmcQ/YjbR family DNA-binding protein [Anaerovoracaceae bacterium]